MAKPNLNAMKNIKEFCSEHDVDYSDVEELLTRLGMVGKTEINKVYDIFGIEGSLSKKSSPYNNAVAEAFNKVMKTEFVYQKKFTSLKQLKLELSEYVYGYNNLRIHGSLGYLTPVKYIS